MCSIARADGTSTEKRIVRAEPFISNGFGILRLRTERSILPRTSKFRNCSKIALASTKGPSLSGSKYSFVDLLPGLFQRGAGTSLRSSDGKEIDSGFG